MKAQPQTLQQIHAALHRLGLLHQKANMVAGYTNERTESSKEMTQEEADAMLADLNKNQRKQVENNTDKDKMIRKIIAMAREMGTVYREKVVDPQKGLVEKSNYTKLNKWMKDNSYLKKPLNKYSYQELPKLVSQFQAVYTDWLRKYH